jgi:O-antigen/teichoic acid export membrane protein
MRTFLVNLGSLLTGNALTLALQFVFSVVLIQRLSQAEFGTQSAILALAAIVMGIADLGLNGITIRELAQCPPEQQRKIYNNLLSLQLFVSGVICMVATTASLLLNSFPGEQMTLLVLGLFTTVFSYAPIVPTEGLMAVRGRMRQIALFQTSYALFTCILAVIVLYAGGGLSGLYMALSILSLSVIVLYMREAWHLLRGKIAFTVQWREWLRYFLQAIPAGVGATLFMSCLRLGTLLVYRSASQEGAGYLGVSFMLIQAVVSIAWVPYAISVLPIMARLYNESQDQLTWLGGRSVILLLTVTLPMTVGAALLPADILSVLNEKQAVGASVLQVLIWVLPLAVLTAFLYRMLLVMKRQRVYLAATAAGAAVNLILCVALIPRYGAEGAALAAVVSTALIVGICLWVLRSWIAPHIRWLDGLRLAGALGAMTLAVRLTPGLPLFAHIALGGLMYVGVILGSKLFTMTDLHATRTLLATAQAGTGAGTGAVTGNGTD